MRRGWLWFAVVISLAANLFLGGLVAGRWLGSKPPAGLRARAPTDIVMPFNPRQFLRALPDERRKEIHAFIRSRTPDVRRAFQAISEAREEVIAALEAEPFDEARLAAAFGETEARFTTAISSVHGTLSDLAAELTAEERKMMAQAIRDKARQRAERRKKRRERRQKEQKRD